MKRYALTGAVVTALLAGVLLARAAWPNGAAGPAVPRPAVAPADVLGGSAGWHYRHNQPTHWRDCLLQQ
jgi:hypothetical protein